MAQIKDTKVYSVNDFLTWKNNGEIELSPKYQRNPVWDEKTKSYLIDTMLRGLPIPQIFIRQQIDVTLKKTLREVIDGQQRLRAIFGFINNEFPIAKNHNEDYGGYFYNDLPEDVQEKMLEYDIPTEIIKVKEDALIYNMFARLNTNSHALNNQELRNAKFWGEFKVFIYKHSPDWADLFIKNKTFRDKELARMADVEFLSVLVISLIDGVITESPTKITSYYSNNDSIFKNQEKVSGKLSKIFIILKKISQEIQIENNIFHTKNYFYTLFNFLNHQMYGIENFSGTRDEIFNEFNIEKNLTELINRINKFINVFERFKQKELYGNNIEEIKSELDIFEKHHIRRTTSLKERQERIEIFTNNILTEEE